VALHEKRIGEPVEQCACNLVSLVAVVVRAQPADDDGKLVTGEPADNGVFG
jgi:hypothetical protein